jgi:hypothetical protein
MHLTRFLPGLRGIFVMVAAGAAVFATASTAVADHVGDVFVIDMENHNWTQPASQSSPGQIFGNAAAPFINSLVTPGSANAAQVSYASNYLNVPAQSQAVHPSLPNYLWQEAGSNFGVYNDNQPGAEGGDPNHANAPSLSGLLQNAGISWKSYVEDSQFDPTKHDGTVKGTYSVPLLNANGTATTGYTNPYFGTGQYNFATKHDGQLYFTATNNAGEVSHYAPLQQLTSDLNSNAVGKYNLIVPNQFNDMHTALNTDFNYAGQTWTHGTDSNAIAVGDHFLSVIVPQIMASKAYQNNGAIVIWFDETEGGDDAQHTLGEIVISKLAVGGAFNSTLHYDHSSDLKSLQELFGVSAPGGGFLGHANDPGVNDLSAMFKLGALQPTPEPSSIVLLGLGGLGCVVGAMRRRRRA